MHIVCITGLKFGAMIIKVKNKMFASMDLSLKEADKKGGIPASIFVDPNEALQILRETAVLNADEKYKGKTIKLQCNNIVPSLIRAPTLKTSSLDLQKMVIEWQTKKISVTYTGLPIIVDPQKPVAIKVAKTSKKSSVQSPPKRPPAYAELTPWTDHTNHIVIKDHPIRDPDEGPIKRD